ncbi:hypothetical protein [Butyrivibrio sp. INlla16]|uniref:hypothetical protein n=1 Tax=Butyrivibrio sp. INlla16 TaxID=1520807 RepID=UPI00088611DA|nr:hypothetical protein [Butyrivibrio sp. INlla16]SDB13313.1 hypothetical protein SAMN02910263_00607 [Butyrivibrio sp. INlla16]
MESQILSRLKIQAVGGGKIDLICPPDSVDEFIDLCCAEGTTIEGFTWWCHVTEGHIPCGMGGPKSVYFDGWFSEIPMDDIIRLGDNESYREFFNRTWPSDKNYHGCYWPGFWIEDN